MVEQEQAKQCVRWRFQSSANPSNHANADLHPRQEWQKLMNNLQSVSVTLAAMQPVMAFAQVNSKAGSGAATPHNCL